MVPELTPVHTSTDLYSLDNVSVVNPSVCVECDANIGNNNFSLHLSLCQIACRQLNNPDSRRMIATEGVYVDTSEIKPRTKDGKSGNKDKDSGQLACGINYAAPNTVHFGEVDQAAVVQSNLPIESGAVADPDSNGASIDSKLPKRIQKKQSVVTAVIGDVDPATLSDADLQHLYN